MNLHVVEAGNPEIVGFIMFRNYLRENSTAREKYSKLKLKTLESKNSAKKNKYGLTQYTLEKDRFIKSIIKKADFRELCIRYTIHYDEIKYIQSMEQEVTYLVFYRGYEIIGCAGIKNKKIVLFNVKDE